MAESSVSAMCVSFSVVPSKRNVCVCIANTSAFVNGGANGLCETAGVPYNRGVFYAESSILVLLNWVWLMLVLFGLPGNWLMVAIAAFWP